MPLPKQEIKFSLFTLSLFFGAYFLLLSLMPYQSGGISEAEEWVMFIQGWLVIPFFSIGASLFIEYIRKLFFRDTQIFYSALLLADSLFLTIAVWVIRLASAPVAHCSSWGCYAAMLDRQVPSWETALFTMVPTPKAVYLFILYLFPMMNAGVLLLLKWLNRSLRKERVSELLQRFSYFFIPLFIGLAMINYSGLSLKRPVFIAAIFLLSFISFFHRKLLDYSPPKIGMRILNIIVVLSVIFLVFDPALSINRAHQNPLLGPVLDLKGDRSLLVDIDCSYGILIVYFLNAVLSILPFSYQGLTLLNIALSIIYYLGIYVLLRYLLKSPIFSAVVLFLIFEANFFATLGGEIVSYPALGVMRFGWPYGLFLLTMLRCQYPSSYRKTIIAEGLIIAMASLWSFETFFYTFSAYIAILSFECYEETKNKRRFLKMMLARIAGLIPLIAALYLLLILYIYFRSGQFPRLNDYLDYIFLYSLGGWGAMPIAPFSPWLLLLAIPFASFLALIYQAIFMDKNEIEPAFPVVAGLTALGIAQFTYFLGRSHPNNLYHICVPAIMTAAFWISYITRRFPPSFQGFYTAFIYSCYFAMLTIFLSLWPLMANKLNLRKDHYPHLKKTLSSLGLPRPSHEKVAEAVSLVHKYAKDKKRILIFLEPDDTTEVLMLSQKTHIFPMNYPVQTSILRRAKERVLAYEPSLREGDMLFLAKGCLEFEEELVKKIQGRFKFIVRAVTPHKIYAIELKSK